MSETATNYTTPPTHNVKRCLRCGSELDWLSDGTLVHLGWRSPQSDWSLCLERQLAKVKQDLADMRKRAEQDAEYFAAAMAFIDDHGLQLDSATLIGYVYTVRQRAAK